jgi:hypothetical protein
MHAYIHTYIHAYIYTHITNRLDEIQSGLNLYRLLLTKDKKHNHTKYIHTYIHTYIYTHTTNRLDEIQSGLNLYRLLLIKDKKHNHTKVWDAENIKQMQDACIQPLCKIAAELSRQFEQEGGNLPPGEFVLCL